jgi:hypothetical protein
VILLGERSLRRALNEYVEHYHAHQGKGHVLLFPRDAISAASGSLFNAGSDWVGSCAIAIKRLGDRMPKIQCWNSDPAILRCD